MFSCCRIDRNSKLADELEEIRGYSEPRRGYIASTHQSSKRRAEPNPSVVGIPQLQLKTVNTSSPKSISAAVILPQVDDAAYRDNNLVDLDSSKDGYEELYRQANNDSRYININTSDIVIGVNDTFGSPSPYISPLPLETSSASSLLSPTSESSPTTPPHLPYPNDSVLPDTPEFRPVTSPKEGASSPLTGDKGYESPQHSSSSPSNNNADQLSSSSSTTTTTTINNNSPSNAIDQSSSPLSTKSPLGGRQEVLKTPAGFPPSKAKGADAPAASVKDLASQVGQKKSPTHSTTKAAAKKGWQPANYSADVSGLRTKDRGKMIDLVDDQFKKELRTTVNFVREISERDARGDSEVPNREKVMILYMMLQSVNFEISGKQNSIATVTSYVTGNAEGDKALATTKVKSAAKKLQFMAKAYYKPILEQLRDPNPKQTVERVVDDIHTTANVLMGEKPPTMRERIDPFVIDIMNSWSWERCHKWQTDDEVGYQQMLSKLLDSLDTCRKTGTGYVCIVESIERTISK